MRQALSIVDEVTTALGYIGTAETAMHGQGFLLDEGIASANQAREQAATTREAYEAFRVQLIEALSPGDALARSFETPLKQRWLPRTSATSGSGWKPCALESKTASHRSRSGPRRRGHRSKRWEAIYKDELAHLAWMAAQLKPTTGAIGDLIGMAEDAGRIQSALEQAASAALRSLQPLLAEDTATIAPWEADLRDVASRGSVWLVPGTEIVFGTRRSLQGADVNQPAEREQDPQDRIPPRRAGDDPRRAFRTLRS